MATFNTLPTFRCWSQPPFKISCKYLYPRLDYNYTFVYSSWRLSAILDFREIANWPNYRLRCWFSNTVPHLVQKCWSTPKLWPKNEIQNGCRRHLEFTSGGYFLTYCRLSSVTFTLVSTYFSDCDQFFTYTDKNDYRFEIMLSTMSLKFRLFSF